MAKPDQLFDRRIGRLRPIHADGPIHSSAGLKWTGVRLEHRRVPAFQFHDVVGQHHIVACHLTGPVELTWQDHRTNVTRTIEAGQVTVVPAHLPHSSSTNATAEIVMLAIEPDFLQMYAHQLGRSSHVALEPVQGITDTLLSGLCTTLLNEVKAGGPMGTLYADALLGTLAAHLVRRFCREDSAPAPRDIIPMRREMRRALEFIHDRLVDAFSLQQLADAAGLSTFHFSRMFKKSTGVPPYRYVLNQRIERAKQLMMTGRTNLAEVAAECGFCDQSHFSSHFKRYSGMTPRQFAERMRPQRLLAG